MAIIDFIKRWFKSVGDNNKRRFRRIVLAAPFWVLVASIGLLASGIIRNVNSIGNRYDQNMASYWGQDADTGFRQVSVFARGSRSLGETSPMMYIDAEKSLNPTDITLMRTSLQGIVDSANPNKKTKGLDSDGRPVGWEDCFSSTINANIEVCADASSNGNAILVNADAEVVAIDGNFKALHPFRFMSGGFLPEVCVDTNQIVLNDVLAWRFFESYDIVGRQVSVWGQTFTVVGVVGETTSSEDRAVGVNASRAYIYFNALEMYAGSGDSESGMNIFAVECYEAILPEQVKNVAVTDLKNALPNYSENNPQLYVVSNTGRFGFFKVWDYVMPIGQTSQIMAQYELPYWERTAQLTTQNVFINNIFIIAGAVLLLIGVIMVILKMRKFAADTK